jgi:agmatinase
MDISEIAPIPGFVAPQFAIARLIYRMMGRIAAARQ